MLTAARLREMLHYDPETGAFTWRARSGGTATAGTSAGTRQTRGYLKISIDNRRYYAHRLAFLYMTGEWPIREVDHVNRNRRDDSWANLRDVTREQNMRNRGATSRNRLGVKGVSQLPGGTYRASIYRDGVMRRLGCFGTIEEAAAAYAKAGGIS